jgi:hypothetical protein
MLDSFNDVLLPEAWYEVADVILDNRDVEHPRLLRLR